MKVLDQRIKRATAVKTDSPAIREALNSLSGFYDVSSAGQSRKELRHVLDQRAVDVAEQFLSALAPFEQSYLKLSTQTDSLCTKCSDLQRHLDQSELQTAEFVAQAEKLRRNISGISSQKAQIESLLAQLRLTQAETAVLTARSIGGKHFVGFRDALARLKTIQAEVQPLLETEFADVGLEILQDTSKRLERAYQRVYELVRMLAREVTSDIESNAQDPTTLELKSALSLLRDRPSLHQDCEEDVVRGRRGALLRRFYTALSKGDPVSGAKPLEAHIYDGVRFVGDVLAWCHQTLIGEKELVVAMFGLAASRPAISGYIQPTHAAGGSTQTVSSNTAALAEGTDSHEVNAVPGGERTVDVDAISGAGHESEGNEERAVVEFTVMDRVMSSLSQQLETRVMDATHQTTDMVLAFRLVDLISFYCSLFIVHLSPSCEFMQSMGVCLQAAVKRLRELVAQQSDRLIASAFSIPGDLRPPTKLYSFLDAVQELLQQYMGSMVGMNDVMEHTRAAVLQAYGGSANSPRAAASPAPSGPATAAEGKGSTGEETGDDVGAAAYVESLCECLEVYLEQLLAQFSIQSLLNGLLEPVLGHITSSADELESVDRFVFMINCLHTIQSSLASQAIASGWVQRLAADLGSWEEVLAECQADEVLAKCGLLHVINTAAGQTGSDVPMSQLPGMSVEELQHAVSEFSGMLIDFELPSIDRVIAPRIQSRVRVDIVRRVADGYEAVCHIVRAPVNEYPADSNLIPYDRDQVLRMLDATEQ